MIFVEAPQLCRKIQYLSTPKLHSRPLRLALAPFQPGPPLTRQPPPLKKTPTPPPPAASSPEHPPPSHRSNSTSRLSPRTSNVTSPGPLLTKHPTQHPLSQQPPQSNIHRPTHHQPNGPPVHPAALVSQSVFPTIQSPNATPAVLYPTSRQPRTAPQKNSLHPAILTAKLHRPHQSSPFCSPPACQRLTSPAASAARRPSPQFPPHQRPSKRSGPHQIPAKFRPTAGRLPVPPLTPKPIALITDLPNAAARRLPATSAHLPTPKLTAPSPLRIK